MQVLPSSFECVLQAAQPLLGEVDRPLSQLESDLARRIWLPCSTRTLQATEWRETTRDHPEEATRGRGEAEDGRAPATERERPLEPRAKPLLTLAQ